MKCVIPGRCIKLFGRSIHCLSRIGEELFFEALKDGLALRTVNSSRSAYACFVFSKMFLGEYEQGCDQIDSSNPAELLKCKITMKSCLGIFKSLATIDKTVNECKIIFQPDKCRLVFILYCKHGIIKTHNLTYQECESLQAVFAKDLCPNFITAQSKVLQDTVANFPNSCEEITLSVCPEYLKITNYVDDEPDPSKVVHTSMTLVPAEFDYFQIGIDTKVTFCLKELRAILAFSEFVNQPLSLHFEQPGKPIVFSFDSDELYQGDFVMATLSENDALTQSTQVSNQVKAAEKSNMIESRHAVTKRFEKKVRKEKITKQKNNAFDMSRNVNNDEKNVDSSANEREKEHKLVIHDNSNCSSDFVEQNSSKLPIINYSSTVTSREGRRNHKHVDKHVDTREDFFTDSLPYKEIYCNTPLERNRVLGLSQHVSVLDNDSSEEVLVCTPPPKKMIKSLFFGTDGTNSNGVENMSVLLAADTDDEDE